MNKIVGGVLLAAAAALSVTWYAARADAQARPAPGPIFTLAPQFDCGATVTGSSGKATITKTNAANVDKTKDVIAVVNTPNGKVTAAICGSAFPTAASGLKASVGFNVSSDDKNWIYTCSASQVSTTLACNPPK